MLEVMSGREDKSSTALRKGQVWKLKRGYLQIAEIGKNFIHYKMLRNLHQHGVLTQMAKRNEVTMYLKRGKALLVHETPPIARPVGRAGEI
jgi:hypothetical protein